MATPETPLLGQRGQLTEPSAHEPLLWTRTSVALAVILVVGSAASSLLIQHVANDVPKYFFSIAAFFPFAGLVGYPLITAAARRAGMIKAGLTRETFSTTLWAMLPVALCFAVNNILTLYGTSGQASGKPEVPTVLALIIQKLVVPVSLAIESIYEWRRPRIVEVVGVALVMVGAMVAALAYRGGGDEGGHGPYYHAKLLCLVSATVPLATGFLLVKRASRIVPTVSEIELWAVLCLPETVFSVGLSYLAQEIHNYEHELSGGEMSSALWTGLKCIVVGVSPTDNPTLPCPNAAKFTWIALIPGFAFNLTIPVLVRQLEDSTVIPLLRAVALPLATLVAMTHVDPVIATSFSWEGVVGLLFAFLGLLICYMPPKWSAKLWQLLKKMGDNYHGSKTQHLR